MSNFGFDPFWRWLDSRPPPEDLPGFRVRPVDVAPVGVPGLAGWQPPVTATAQPAPESAPFATEAASQPWWERPTGPNSVFEGGSETYWPWLRAPTDDVPGFRLNPDGSVRSDKQGGDVRLMAGALTPRRCAGRCAWPASLATIRDRRGSVCAGRHSGRYRSRTAPLVGASNRTQQRPRGRTPVALALASCANRRGSGVPTEARGIGADWRAGWHRQADGGSTCSPRTARTAE